MSGKTTVGEKIAELLQWEFIDTDHLLQKVHGCTCRELYAKLGEMKFRELEREQILSLNGKQSVISLGGGSLNDPENRRKVAAIGTLIYLKADENILFERITRVPAYLDPIDPKRSFLELAQKRKTLYKEAANLIIETSGLNEGEVAAGIIKELSYG